MAYTTINKSTDYFNTKLYTGAGTSGSPFSLTGVGFAPDWTWIKRRDGAAIGHRLFDRVRGATKYIDSSATSAETTNTSTLTAFGSDGFTLQNEGSVNDGSALFTSWNWKAGGGQGSSNTDGSINTTYTSVNTTAGFSISQYTGTGSVGTIGHGLGAVPKMIITKPYSTTGQWYTYHASLGNTHYLDLVSTAAASDDAEMWNDTSPTSSLFTVGVNGNTNGSGKTTIAYAFAEKIGYSKFGSYIGNGSTTNGTFVYTGFKPAWIMIKRYNASGHDWVLIDDKRLGYNPDNNTLLSNTSAAEQTDNRIDILSNGFKHYNNNGSENENNGTYIYMCFASAPLVGSNNVPCTAR